MSFKNQLKKLIQESKVIRSGLFASKMILNEQDDLDPGNWNWWTGIGPQVGGVIWAPTGYDGDNYAVDSNFSNLSFGDNYSYSSQDYGSCGGNESIGDYGISLTRCCGEGGGMGFCSYCSNMEDVLNFVVESNWTYRQDTVFFLGTGQIDMYFSNPSNGMETNFCSDPNGGTYKYLGNIVLNNWVWEGCNICDTSSPCGDAYPGFGCTGNGGARFNSSDKIYDWLTDQLGLDISGATSWDQVKQIYNNSGGSAGTEGINTECVSGTAGPGGCGSGYCRCVTPGLDGHEGTIGCMDPEACNYDPDATISWDGALGWDWDPGDPNYGAGVTGCVYEDDCGVCGELNSAIQNWNESCTGCMDPEASNYDPDATIDFGDENAGEPSINNPQEDNWECLYTPGCMNPEADNYDETAVSDDGSCYFNVYTCDPIDDWISEWGMTISSCSNPWANYNDPEYITQQDTPADGITSFEYSSQCEDVCGVDDTFSCWKCGNSGNVITTQVPVPYPMFGTIIYYGIQEGFIDWETPIDGIVQFGQSCPEGYQHYPIPTDACGDVTPDTDPGTVEEKCAKLWGYIGVMTGQPPIDTVEKFCTRCEQDQPTSDPLYGTGNQYWVGGPGGQFDASYCKCCDLMPTKKPGDDGLTTTQTGGTQIGGTQIGGNNPSSITPVPSNKKVNVNNEPTPTAPITPIRENFIKRFQKLAGIKKKNK